jgi:hypothetical protein
MNVVPGVSIGSFALGMTRAEIHAQSASPIRPFLKTPMATRPTDDIVDLGVHVHYDADERCSLIEAWTPEPRRDAKLTIGDIEIEGKTMLELRGVLGKLSSLVKTHDEGFESASDGLGIYCHEFPSEDSLLDGVYVFRPHAAEA